MIALDIMKDRRVVVFGLGASGQLAARALKEGGAQVIAADDDPEQPGSTLSPARLRRIDWSAIDALVLAPGIPLTHPEPHWTVKLARRENVEIIGDIELFYRQRAHLGGRCPFVAITGTNGKSTTTALIGHMLREAGFDTQIGGNIGKPVLDLAPITPERAYVIECSSYQIDLAPRLRPTIGILLNISADHLERHGRLENYAAIKARLVAGADTAAIIGVDDEHTQGIAARLVARGRPVVAISARGAIDAAYPRGVYVQGGDILALNGGDTQRVAGLEGIATLRGTHNAQNAAAAVATCQALDVDDTTIRRSLASFAGLAHRMQPVARRGDVVFVNDSKATNAMAAAQALGSYTDIHWIAGGLLKEGGIDSLEPLFSRITKAYLIGESAPIIAAKLGGHVDYELCQTLANAVRRAARDAANAAQQKARTPMVLLSPACASFDQFRNFEERGQAFVDTVATLDGITHPAARKTPSPATSDKPGDMGPMEKTTTIKEGLL